MVAVNLWYHVGPANEDAGTHRLRAPVRAHDVSGLEARRRPTRTSSSSRRPAPATSTARPISTAPTTSRPCRRISWSSRCGSSPTAWAICSTCSTQTQLANQQDVVRNERRQSFENQPYGVADEALYQALFPPGIRTTPTSSARTPTSQAAQARRREALLPAVLRAEQRQPRDRRRLRQGAAQGAGREVLRHAEARRRRCRRSRATTPPITAEKRRTVVTDRSSCRASTVAGSRSPIYKPGDADADIAATILGGGKSSRLYKTLVYDKQIAQNVSAQPGVADPRLHVPDRRDGQARATRPRSSRRRSTRSCDASRDTGPDAGEVERARNTIETRIITGLETLGGFGGKADRLNSYNHYLGNA